MIKIDKLRKLLLKTKNVVFVEQPVRNSFLARGDQLAVLVNLLALPSD